MSRARLVLASGLGAAALVTGGLASGAVTASALAEPGDSATCPAAFPADELTLGDGVTGLTTAGSYRRDGVEHDSTTVPEGFTGIYRGSIDDPGGDLLVFELEGSRITHSDGSVDAGIWAGMSGSPVFAADGRLIGAVSYSFTGLLGSTFAGVTPADQLYDLLDDGAPAAPARIKLSSKEQQQLVRGGLPATAAERGLRQLTPEVTLSGVKGAKQVSLNRIAERFGMAAPSLTGGTSGPAEEVPIVPGSNFAAADSFGTISLFGVGTTTAVCDDRAIAFGHPANWAPSTESVHGATTTIIQGDGAGSYKMANLAAPVGTLVSDHLAGIVGQLGEIPATATVSSTTTGPKPRQSLSHVPNPAALGYVVANQTYLDTLLTLDQDAGGSVSLSWKITYQRADGSTHVFTRSNEYAADSWLSEVVTADVGADVDAIVNNPFEPVVVTDVEVTEDASREFRMLKLGKVELRQGKKWLKLQRNGKAPLKPGTTMKLRINLVPSSGASTASAVSKVVSVKIPKKATRTGHLAIVGNGVSFDDFYFDEYYPEENAAKSLPALLARLQAQPGQDDVTIQLMHAVKGKKKPRVVTQTWQAPDVTTGSFDVRLKQAGAKARR
ncbi:hypothetical protein ASG90_15945 [Nocardioides sp. Soil797]|nr:hypothetical protein ASG90_15945 [Nocardioides sp. Soil797]